MEIKLEVSGPGAHAAKELFGATRGALRKILGPPLEEFGLMLGDHVRAFRIRNLLRLDANIRAVAKAYGLKRGSFQLLPVGDAIRTIDAASMEENDDVQQLWARLIIKAASGEQEQDRRIDKLYIELLKSLSATDAALLELLHEGPQFRTFTSVDEVTKFNESMNRKAEEKWRKFSSDERDVSVQNLSRLRCITFAPQILDANNLMKRMPRRIGNLEFSDAAVVDPRRMEEVLAQILERIYVVSGVMEPRDKTPLQLQTRSVFGSSYSPVQITVPESMYYLTPLGIGFMKAVTLPRAPSSRKRKRDL
jgi:hypothetical protein